MKTSLDIYNRRSIDVVESIKMSALDELAEDPEFEEFQERALGFFAQGDDPDAAARAFFDDEFEAGVEALGKDEEDAIHELETILEHGQGIAERNPELMARLVAEMQEDEETEELQENESEDEEEELEDEADTGNR